MKCFFYKDTLKIIFTINRYCLISLTYGVVEYNMSAFFVVGIQTL